LGWTRIKQFGDGAVEAARIDRDVQAVYINKQMEAGRGSEVEWGVQPVEAKPGTLAAA
jgi:hypothetical protein